MSEANTLKGMMNELYKQRHGKDINVTSNTDKSYTVDEGGRVTGVTDIMTEGSAILVRYGDRYYTIGVSLVYTP